MPPRKRRPNTTHDPRIEGLIERLLEVANAIDRPYAVGGAIAMEAHGYARYTKDLDVYVDHGDRALWFRALRATGLKLSPLFTGVHYIAFLPEHEDPEVRIDLLLPAEDLELSAIAFPDRKLVGDREVEVFPLDLLVIAKFNSDRDKDKADLTEMVERGMVSPSSVLPILRRLDDDLADRFEEEFGGGRCP